MSASASTASPPLASTGSTVVVALLPIMAAVFMAFLVTGVALPALPLHVHDGLGLGTFAVGLVAGSQFAASLVSRVWAGSYADGRGAKRAVIAGLIAASLAGALYLLSLACADAPVRSAAILLLGRAVLGGAESFVITGALSWGLALGGAQHAGKVMAWIGTAMYAAFAGGAPAGGALYAAYGFRSIALATLLVPLAILPLLAPLRAAPPRALERPSLVKVAGAVLVPGIGLAFSSLGFGAVMTFVVLLYGARGWSHGWVGVSAFAAAFIVARVVLGHLPDRLGGARVALVSVLLEAAGLAVIWASPWAWLALAGTVLAGLGYSLVYPGFGVEAVRRAPAQSRGLAMGAYTACFDVALGIANPALGAIAGASGVSAVFLASAITVLGAALIALRLLRAQP